MPAPHGRPNLRSRLPSCHAQEGGPRSAQGHAVAMGGKKLVLRSNENLAELSKFALFKCMLYFSLKFYKRKEGKQSGFTP